jgi:ubiquinone/menaquinone biosynthesis C-methylase UbiE
VSRADPDWYEGFFGADYLAVAPRDPERTTREADFVVERLGLEPGNRILDLACGHGRHAVELARRGFRVTGLDLSEPSLAEAREAAAAAGVDLELVLGDMRELPWTGEFDAVVSIFTAFGYFADESDDERVLAEVERALRPGGSFLLDVVNVFLLARGFQARRWQELEDGRALLEDLTFDHLTGRSNVVWTFVDPRGERTELRHSLRVYTLPELSAMLARAGLEPVETWGDFEGAPFGFESRRLIVRARKRA